jgi:hypothetical protein
MKHQLFVFRLLLKVAGPAAAQSPEEKLALEVKMVVEVE